MKKLSCAALTIILITACMALFFSCQSSNLPSLKLDPLALLSDDSSIYVKVPVQNHKELTSRILCAEVPSMSEKDADRLVSYIDILYAALGTVKDRSRLELSASHSISSIAVKHVLSAKNGWKSETKEFETENSISPFYFNIYSRKDIDLKLSFPDAGTFVCAKEIDSLLSKVDFSAVPSDTPWNNWISESSSDILFYITKPGQYLRNLIGTSIAGVDAVWGTVSYMPSKDSSDYSGKYNLSFYLHLKDSRAVKAFNSFLALSFAMTGGSAEQVDSNTILLTGVEISVKQIQELFTRDPITGKHFKVQGESIITEKRK